MVKPSLGTKRTCTGCGAKFYDLEKDPIVCPKCGTSVDLASLIKVAKPATAAGAVRAQADEDVDLPLDEAAELISLEEADEEQAGGAKSASLPDVDVDIDDDLGDTDDTFLEEDEDDDAHVADLIDGDLEEDEEG